jgi:hypothetical protein
VGSFSPPGPYRSAWQLFISDATTCLSGAGEAYETVVLDVMQNGGGYVCLGYRLLTLLFPYFHANTSRTLYTYDLPHSTFMDGYIKNYNHNNPYIDPQAVEEILDPSTLTPFPDGAAYYYPGREVVQGGVSSRHSNPFVLDCREAFAMSPSFAPPGILASSKARVTILTDGTCGSTCASFSKTAQEADTAHFVGLGGLWDMPMDVASFAGGFVSNPGYLQTMAQLASLPPFPQFITSVGGWQFAWAVWYSQRFPDRPIQFTQQAPDSRLPFWNFPHVSVPSAVTSAAVSLLYDQAVTDTLARVKLAQPSTTSDSGSRAWRVAFVVTTVVLGGSSVVLACWARRLKAQLNGVVSSSLDHAYVRA